MSHATEPINATAFSQALESLPVDALHSKAAELQNSVSHLKSSNEQMLPFADEGDQGTNQASSNDLGKGSADWSHVPDCKDAMFENLVVIGRMNERIALLRVEVEKRGMRWADAEVEDRDQEMKDEEGHMTNGSGSHAVTATASQVQQTREPSGRLTDEELMTRLQERLGDPDGNEDGVHL